MLQAARQEAREQVRAIKRKANEEIRVRILTKRAKLDDILTAEQKSSLAEKPIVVLDGVPPNVGKKFVYKNVQKYGKVNKIHLPKTDQLVNSGLGYLHFDEAQDAIKLLQAPYIEIDDVCVEVRPIAGQHEMVEAFETEPTELEGAADKYKIQVYGLDPTVVAKEIYGHFAILGAVLAVDVPRSKKKNCKHLNRGFAFVSFAREEGMRAALDNPRHKIKFKSCKVRQAMSRESGQQEETEEEEEEEAESEEIEEEEEDDEELELTDESDEE